MDERIIIERWRKSISPKAHDHREKRAKILRARGYIVALTTHKIPGLDTVYQIIAQKKEGV